MFQCHPCGKTFTGRVCYDQHMESDKHKRKVLSSGFLNSQSDASINLADKIFAAEPRFDYDKIIKCDVCNITFHFFEDFQNHSVSPEHALKVIQEKSNSSISCNIISSSGNLLENHDDTRREDGPIGADEMILPEFDNYKKSQALSLSYGSCEICSKTFSGPQPYRQHLESATHKKKVEIQKNIPSSDLNLNPNAIFSCNPCKKNFSGQVPYVQHINSDTHKKKLQQVKDLENYLSVASSKIQEVNKNPWFCETCNVQCSGLIPYQQHVSGSIHFKNSKRVQGQRITTELKDPLKSAIQEGTENENRILEECVNVPQFINVSNQKGKEKMEEAILPELVDGIKVMSVEELEQSIKIFYPEDTIDFDKSEVSSESATKSVCHNVVENGKVTEKSNFIEECNSPCDASRETDIDKVKDKSEFFQKFDSGEVNMEEIKENFEVFQVCGLCNVQLFNKNDVADHFESLEHFTRRWRSN